MNLQAYAIALKELGQREIPGEQDNPRIVDYHDFTTLDANDDETAWCSAFVNYCVAHAKGKTDPGEWLALGPEGTGKANARSWLSYPNQGEGVRGDIVILWRISPDDWRGHVGFVCEPNDGRGNVLTLGGNQGNAVTIKAYPRARILGFREV